MNVSVFKGNDVLRADRTPNSRALFSLGAAAAIAIFSIGGPAFACAFDLVKPERTAIDWIVEAEVVVQARPTVANPFEFEVVQTLVGDASGAKIPFLVDSFTRRKLEASEDASVLFVKTSGTGWTRVGFVDDAFRPVLEKTLAHREDWSMGRDDARLALIEELQRDQDPRLASLVIAELDKVPYDKLQKMDLRISADRLLAELASMRGYPFRATRVLLLGLDGSSAARTKITSYFDDAPTWSAESILGAYAAAFIEIDGAQAVQHLANRFFTDKSQPQGKLDQITLALATHNASAGPELRNAIERAISLYLEHRPEAGATVARQFGTLSDWSQADNLLDLMSTGKVTNVGQLIAVSGYVAQAQRVSRFEPEQAQPLGFSKQPKSFQRLDDPCAQGSNSACAPSTTGD